MKSNKKHVRCITVNTDASFNSDMKIGGYAFYIVCDLFKIQKGGYFKGNPNSPMEAEMMCMANALHTLLSQKELPYTDLIIINSDCLWSFQHIGLKNSNLIGRKVAQIIKKVRIRTTNFPNIITKHEFRHVKAHNGTDDARSWVNDWCDREAKKWMRKRVEEIKSQLIE